MTKDELELKVKEKEQEIEELKSQIKNHITEKQYLASTIEEKDKEIGSYLKELDTFKSLNVKLKEEANTIRKNFESFRESLKTSKDDRDKKESVALEEKWRASLENENRIAKIADDAMQSNGEFLNLMHTLIESQIKLHNYKIKDINAAEQQPRK